LLFRPHTKNLDDDDDDDDDDAVAVVKLKSRSVKHTDLRRRHIACMFSDVNKSLIITPAAGRHHMVQVLSHFTPACPHVLHDSATRGSLMYAVEPPLAL